MQKCASCHGISADAKTPVPHATTCSIRPTGPNWSRCAARSSTAGPACRRACWAGRTSIRSPPTCRERRSDPAGRARHPRRARRRHGPRPHDPARHARAAPAPDRGRESGRRRRRGADRGNGPDAALVAPLRPAARHDRAADLLPGSADRRSPSGEWLLHRPMPVRLAREVLREACGQARPALQPLRRRRALRRRGERARARATPATPG